jgi:uncharacterized protein (TIGR03000 family)
MKKGSVTMRNVKTIGIGLVVVACLATPSSARAQYFFGGSPYGYGMGNWGGYGLGNWGGYGLGGLGGYGFGGLPYGYGPPAGYGPPGGYGSPYNYNYNPNGAPIIVPGFAASDPVRARPALYPAIPKPSPDNISAALATDEKDKARIDIKLPSHGAKVYLEGVLTKQTGLDRMFITPKLNPGAKYVMNVEVVWQTANGQNRTIRRQVAIRPGQVASLDFSEGF